MRRIDVVVDLVRPVVPRVGHLLVRSLALVWWGVRQDGAERRIRAGTQGHLAARPGHEERRASEVLAQLRRELEFPDVVRLALRWRLILLPRRRPEPLGLGLGVLLHPRGVVARVVMS